MKKLLFYTVFFLFAIAIQGQQKLTLSDTIAAYFNEIKLATKKETLLWARDLNGPVLLVNPGTRQLYANYPDSAGKLKMDGAIYTGTLPVEINIANTAIDWGGRRWAMIMLPLPAGKADRINLMAHELFHVAQPALNLQFLNTDNNHLDQKEGRIYLRLELEALRKAINGVTNTQTKMYLRDALAFRKYRHAIYPGSDSTENVLEMQEGLAEYTGFIISGKNKKQAAAHFNQSLNNFLSNPTFVRSFTYQTIPMYGYLLKTKLKYWHKNITRYNNLTNYFSKAFGINLKNDLEKYTQTSFTKYNAQIIIAEETVRQEKVNKLVAAYKSKFIDSPHFQIQFEQMNVSFNPGNIMPVEDKGTVYPNMRVSDNWGILTVTNGALMSPGWDNICITVPETINGKNINGDGWTLILNDAYSIVKEENNGNYKLLKK